MKHSHKYLKPLQCHLSLWPMDSFKLYPLNKCIWKLITYLNWDNVAAATKTTACNTLFDALDNSQVTQFTVSLKLSSNSCI